MEAKDTVMTHEETARVLDANVPNCWSCTQREAEIIRQAQAEISFKAGEVEGYKQGLEMREPYLAGIREVVEDIEANYMVKNSANPDFLRNGIIIASPEQWQAFRESKLNA